MNEKALTTLFTDVWALRLVMQNEMRRAAARSGEFAEFLAKRHEEVHDDARRIQTDEPTRMVIDAAIDRFFAPLLHGPPPPAES
jgi:hypothetical protein